MIQIENRIDLAVVNLVNTENLALLGYYTVVVVISYRSFGTTFGPIIKAQETKNQKKSCILDF